jgi:DNA-directed RNA polymerase subunit beta'
MEKIFLNQTLDKNTTKKLLSWFLDNYSELRLGYFLDEMKSVGFHFATKAGFSLGFDDLRIPDGKERVLKQAELEIFECENDFIHAKINSATRYQRLLAVWAAASESLKDEVTEYFEETDFLNPLYMMAFSGARGNISQVRQLIGMRGLMSDSSGGVIDFPIRSNFREGLSVTEYAISCYGARKGLIDTALRTADSGYLTRRLVDVAQKLVIGRTDCGTNEYFLMYDLRNEERCDPEALLIPAEDRVLGRLLGETLYFQDERISPQQPYQPYAHPSDPSWRKNANFTEAPVGSTGAPIKNLSSGPYGSADSFLDKTEEFSKISGKPVPRWVSTSVFKINKGATWVYKNFLPRDVFIRNPRSRLKQRNTEPTGLAGRAKRQPTKWAQGRAKLQDLQSDGLRPLKTTRSLSFHRFSNPVLLTVIDYESRGKKEEKRLGQEDLSSESSNSFLTQPSSTRFQNGLSAKEIWPDQFEAIDGRKLLSGKRDESGSHLEESEVGPGLLILRPIERMLLDGKPRLNETETSISEPLNLWSGGLPSASPHDSRKLDSRKLDQRSSSLGSSGLLREIGPENFPVMLRRRDVNTVIGETSSKFSGGMVREKKYHSAGQIAFQKSSGLQDEENFQVYLLGVKNEEILPDLLEKVSEYREPDQGIPVRSALTCRSKSVDWNIGKNDDICQYCYGWNLATGRLVFIGEAVGILAAQSIGEPGTQLTMRTFHTGGVFSAEVEAKVFAPHGGLVSFSRKLPLPQFTTALGQKAFFITEELQVKISQGFEVSESESLVSTSNLNFIQTYNEKSIHENFQKTEGKKLSSILELPPYSYVFIFPGQKIERNQVCAEISKNSGIPRKAAETFTKSKPVRLEIQGQIGRPEEEVRLLENGQKKWVPIDPWEGKHTSDEFKTDSLQETTSGVSAAKWTAKEVSDPEIGFHEEYIWVFSGKPVSYPRIAQSCDYISPEIGFRDSGFNNLVGSKGIVSFEKKQNFSLKDQSRDGSSNSPQIKLGAFNSLANEIGSILPFKPLPNSSSQAANMTAGNLTAGNLTTGQVPSGQVPSGPSFALPDNPISQELERSSLVSIQEYEKSNFLSFLTYFQSSQKSFIKKTAELSSEAKGRSAKQYQQKNPQELTSGVASNRSFALPAGSTSATERSRIGSSGLLQSKNEFQGNPRQHLSTLAKLWFGAQSNLKKQRIKRKPTKWALLVQKVEPAITWESEASTAGNLTAGNLTAGNLTTGQVPSGQVASGHVGSRRPLSSDQVNFQKKTLDRFFDSEEFENHFHRLLFFLETIEPVDFESKGLQTSLKRDKVLEELQTRSRFSKLSSDSLKPFSYVFWKDLESCFQQKKISETNSLYLRATLTKLLLSGVKHFPQFLSGFGELWLQGHINFDRSEEEGKLGIFGLPVLEEPLYHERWNFSLFDRWNKYYWTKSIQLFWPQKKYSDVDPMLVGLASKNTFPARSQGLLGKVLPDETNSAEGNLSFSQVPLAHEVGYSNEIGYQSLLSLKTDFRNRLLFQLEVLFGERFDDDNVASAAPVGLQGFRLLRDLRAAQDKKSERLAFELAQLRRESGETFEEGAYEENPEPTNPRRGFPSVEHGSLDSLDLADDPEVIKSLASIRSRGKEFLESLFNPDPQEVARRPKRPSNFFNDEKPTEPTVKVNKPHFSEHGFDEQPFEFHGKLGSHQKTIVDWEFRKWVVGGFSPSPVSQSTSKSGYIASNWAFRKSRDFQSRLQTSWSFAKKLHQRGWSKEMVKAYVSSDPFFEMAEVPLIVESKPKDWYSSSAKVRIKPHDQGETFDWPIDLNCPLSVEETKTATDYEFQDVSFQEFDANGERIIIDESTGKPIKLNPPSSHSTSRRTFSPVEADKEFFLAVDLGETTRPFQREIEKETQKYVKPKKMRFRQPELNPELVFPGSGIESGQSLHGGDILEPDEYSEEGEISLREVEFFNRKSRNQPVFGEIGEIHTRAEGNPSDAELDAENSEVLISRRHNFSRMKESQLPEYNFVQFTDLRLWNIPGHLLWVNPVKWQNGVGHYVGCYNAVDSQPTEPFEPTESRVWAPQIPSMAANKIGWRDRRLNWSKLPSIQKKLQKGLFDPKVFSRSLGELTVSGNPFQGMKFPLSALDQGMEESAENQISFDKSNQIVRRTWLAKTYSLAYTLRLLHPYRTDFSRGNFALREKSLEVREGEILKSQEFLFSQTYEESRTGDIVQGLPKIEQLFEARRSSPFTLVTLHQELKKQFTYFCEKFPPLHAARLSLRFIQRVLVDEIQLIYHEQGVDIHDKHVELIVRQMTRRVAIRDSGTTHFLSSSVVELDILERYAVSRKNKFNQYQKYSSNLADTGLVIEPVILGLTKTSLVTTNFLSAASFQEARRMLFVAATKSSVDFLSELKHDVLVGRYLRAGSTFHGNTRLSSLQKRPGV